MIQFEEHIFSNIFKGLVGSTTNEVIGYCFLHAHQQSRAKEMEKFYQTEMSEEAEGFPEKWREGRVVVDVGEVRIIFFGSSHLKMNQPFLELARWFQAFLVSFYPDFLGEMMQFD